MNTAISPSRASATEALKPLPINIIPPAPPAGKKREPLTCEQRDGILSDLKKLPNDGGVNSLGRFAGNLLYILDTPSNCPSH